jgi:uncharacterized protein (TIGR02996 family)
MPDHDSFLAAIVASPDDDLPRLVYADFLDEMCQPGAAARAEFIRVQCELERLPPGDDRRTGLVRRERRLRRKHAGGWVTDLQTAQVLATYDPVDSKRPLWQFRRGFLHAVTVVAQRFAEVAEPLFRLAPSVRAVRLTQGSGAVAGILGTPLLARVAELDLTRMCTCGRCPILAELRTLFASPLVSNLTRLTIAQDRVDPETVAALVASPHLNGLQALDLGENALGLAGVRALAAAHGFARLRELNLSENGITPYGGRVLAAAPWLKGLRVLDLSRNRLTDTSGRALLNAEFGEGLERLDLLGNEFSREMRKALVTRFGEKVRCDRTR